MYIKDFLGAYCADVEQLNLQQKILLGVFFLRSQSHCVEQFDQVYGGDLLSFYENVINELILSAQSGGPTSSLTYMREECRKLIPDTDEFQSTEGTLAQYAMVSACYLISFVFKKDLDELFKLLDMYIESIYAQGQFSGESLNNDVFREQVVDTWTHLIKNLT